MINNSFKKIGLICLGVASLCLVGCFHIPDENWLPNKNKVKTGEVKKDVEFEQAVDSLMNGIDQISYEWNEMKNGENNEVNAENLGNDVVEIEEHIEGEENIGNEEVVENVGEVVENNEVDAENLEDDIVEMEENIDGEENIENEEVVENVGEVVENDLIYEE